MKRVLMVAFQFPPFAGSSAVQRTLRFVQHLPAYGWEAIVLTADPHAYEASSGDLLSSIPPNVVVERAFALDAARHLSIGRRYPGFLARPDRWSTWRFGAMSAGQRLIRHFHPDSIWSTFPIATAHVIAGRLHKRSNLPWLADFRDPMAQEGYPADPRTWRSYKEIEEKAVRGARFSIFTTPGAMRMYRERYPDVSAESFRVIENGFDEESFSAAEAAARAAGPLVPERVTILHSGVVYPSERDPTALFDALARMKGGQAIDSTRFQIRFRAAGHEQLLRDLAKERGISELVELLPALPYRQALEEMLRADALLVLQASNCNEQIPAKLYEYLRAMRPILGLTDPRGDTAATLRRAGVATIAPLDRSEDIEGLLRSFLVAIGEGRAPLPEAAAVHLNSRLARAAELAALLEAARR